MPVETGFPNAVVTGIVTGSVIALGAIGLSLVYSIAEVPNFAHGELLTLGAYTALLVNKPGTVPVFELLAVSTQAASVPGLAFLFLVGAGALLGVIYLLGGYEMLAGGWLPVAVPDPAGYAATAVVAAVVGLLVVTGTPSVWGGVLLAVVVLAGIGPLVERIVFGKFRAKGTDLATMLIVTLGVSFVLRFSTQALFGGQSRTYEVPDTATVAGTEIPLSATQFFDLYVTGGGLVVRMADTSTGTDQTAVEVLTVAYSWPVVVVGLAATVAAAVAGYRWRNDDETSYGTAGQTVGPRLTAVFIGVGTFLVAAAILGGSADVPDSFLYGTRVSLSVMRASAIGIALTMMGLLHVVLKETKLGTAMRASSDNIDLAKVTGINTDRVMMATWIIAGAYAAIAGVMLGVLFSQITPNMGFFILLPMFAGVILGGIGSVYGAMVGSFFVGLSMDVGIFLLDIGTTLRIPVAFAVLFVVLLVKPEGIVGGRGA
ncbi:MAG: branched-chain amino acid ABC transporter permease [Halobaculum sp.]